MPSGLVSYKHHALQQRLFVFPDGRLGTCTKNLNFAPEKYILECRWLAFSTERSLHPAQYLPTTQRLGKIKNLPEQFVCQWQYSFDEIITF
jgi:hypothetical protein